MRRAVGYLDRRCQSFHDSLERRPFTYLTAFIAIFFAVNLVRASRLLLWMDELFTFYIVHQPTIRDSIQAIREGCDGAPPLYSLLVRVVETLGLRGATALRMPALLGVCTMGVCVFVFVRRRGPAVYAIFATLLACYLARYYATEARPYALELGAAGLAIVFWQASKEDFRRAAVVWGLGISLAVAIAAHYYAVFLLLPLLAAEFWKRDGLRNLDFPVLAALTLPIFILAPHLPLIKAGARFIPFFWGKVLPAALTTIYHSYLDPVLLWFVPALLPVAISHDFQSAETTRDFRSFTKAELILCIGLSLLPAVIFTASRLTATVFAREYAIVSILGFALVLSLVLRAAAVGNRLVPVIALGAMTALLTWNTAKDLRQPVALREGEIPAQLLSKLPDGPDPILIANTHIFLELSFYCPPQLRRRITIALDPEVERAYEGFDTDHLLLSALRHRVPLNAPDFGAFMAGHRKFLLAARDTDGLLWYLQRTCRMRMLDREAPFSLFAVETTN